MNQECFQELVKCEVVIKYPRLKLRGEASVGGRAIRGSEYTWYPKVVNDLLRNGFRYRRRPKTELWGISACILEAVRSSLQEKYQSEGKWKTAVAGARRRFIWNGKWSVFPKAANLQKIVMDNWVCQIEFIGYLDHGHFCAGVYRIYENTESHSGNSFWGKQYRIWTSKFESQSIRQGKCWGRDFSTELGFNERMKVREISLCEESCGHNKPYDALVIANTLFQQHKRRLHMDITRWSTLKLHWLHSLQSKMEKVYLQSAKTRPGADRGSDHELLIAKFRLKVKKVGKTTRPFRYDLYQIPYDYTVELRNRFKGLGLIECLKN